MAIHATKKSDRIRRLTALATGAVLLAGACTIDVPAPTPGDAAADYSASSDGVTSESSAPDDAAPNDSASDNAMQDDAPQDDAAEDAGAPDDSDASAPDDNAAEAGGTVGSIGVGDVYYPALGNGGYDVQRYDLTIDWNNDDRTIAATNTISMVTTQELSRFNLELIGFEISDVTVNGSPAAWTRQDDELSIIPDGTLDRDEAATVMIAYRGKPSTVPSSLGIAEGWIDLGDGIIVAGEPRGAAGWFPVNEHPTDKAIYNVTVTADDDLSVASNGTLTSSETVDGRTTWAFTNEDPMASYLLTLAIGDYERHDGRSSQSGVPVRHYFHTATFETAVATMERTGEMIDAFEQIFGPYPFENYGTVVANEPFSFALETQTLSVFGNDLLIDQFDGYEAIVAHELAHQWFGNHVSLGQWSDIWLNEGFATYSEFLWEEASLRDYDLDAQMRDEYNAYAPFLQVPAGDPSPDDLFNSSVYLRGAFTLHALRTTIGDDVFFRLVRTWIDEYGGSHATTGEFISLAEDISGQDLEAFFQGWLFDSPMPPLPA